MGKNLLPAPGPRLAPSLLAWFDENRRELPWRSDRTPYRVWLSEVMLQQTRVAVVVEYFRRFIARFPDVHHLAAAGEDEVLSLWSGLGYYSRGRNLHAAARVVVERHGGRFPSSAEGLRTLPGVGPYTAAAVASLAFGESAAVVDGNVARVLARLSNDQTPVDSARGREGIRARAQLLVDSSSRPGAVNEALMELGALVCTPRSPSCGACPWRSPCAALQSGRPEALPVKAPRRARKTMRVASVVITDVERPGRIWLERRARERLFGGLFEPPSCEIADDAESAWRELLRARGLPTPRRFATPVVLERTLTHRDLMFAAQHVSVRGSEHPSACWIDDVAQVGTSTAVRALLKAVLSATPPAVASTAARSRTRRRAPRSSARGRTSSQP